MPDKLALRVENLNVYYGDIQVLFNVSLEIREKEIVSVIGANGAGKSTLLNTIAGLIKPTGGRIEFIGRRIDGIPPHETVPMGLSLVPEGRRLFPRMTVYENLIMGAYNTRMRKNKDMVLDRLYDLFPRLKERKDHMADSLSGGEQQMLAIARAMMSGPRLILCDEISLGLAPVVVKDIYERLAQINREGVTIVLVEQDVKRSLRTSDRAYIMLEGRIVLEGPSASLEEDAVKKAYFGI